MRILSPHLTIYKFPITAISSITNRLTGIYIIGFSLITSFFWLNNNNKKEYIYNMYNNNNTYIKRLCNYTLLYPFGYHFTGGIRHLIWDKYPNLLTNMKVAKSSKLIYLISILPTATLEYKINKTIS